METANYNRSGQDEDATQSRINMRWRQSRLCANCRRNHAEYIEYFFRNSLQAHYRRCRTHARKIGEIPCARPKFHPLSASQHAVHPDFQGRIGKALFTRFMDGQRNRPIFGASKLIAKKAIESNRFLSKLGLSSKACSNAAYSDWRGFEDDIRCLARS